MRNRKAHIIVFKSLQDQWPDNGSYDGWWGHDTLPKLNYVKNLRNWKITFIEIGKMGVSSV